MHTAYRFLMYLYIIHPSFLSYISSRPRLAPYPCRARTLSPRRRSRHVLVMGRPSVLKFEMPTPLFGHHRLGYFECRKPTEGAPRPDGPLELPFGGLLARRGRGVMPRGGGGANHGRRDEAKSAARALRLSTPLMPRHAVLLSTSIVQLVFGAVRRGSKQCDS